MKNSKIKSIIVIALGFLLTTSCEDSTGPTTPVRATISGTITFSGNWPDTGIIEVSAMEIWDYSNEDYTGVPEKSKEISQSDVTSNTYPYSLDLLPFNTYNAIIVTWLDEGDENHQTMYHTLGAYGGDYPFFSAHHGVDPTPVTVSDTLYELTTININADLKYVDACSKQTTQETCETLDHCTWYPAGSMGPSQTSDGCY